MALTKAFNRRKKAYKVTFSLPLEVAPESKDVRVVGEFNNWNWDEAINLKKKKNEFVGNIDLTPGRYEFRYLIDKEDWANDWAADEYVAAPFPGIDNSVVVLKPAPAAAPKTKTTSKAKTAKTTKKLDFTKIEGIGPKINQLILDAGITTFKKLAKTTPKKLKSILLDGGNRFKMHDPGTWPAQATLIVNEDWDGLKKLQDELKGGK